MLQSIEATYIKGMPKFYSVECIERIYNHTSQGHWFSSSTIAFWRTRYTSHFRQVDAENYLFVTTDRTGNGSRAATIRHLRLEAAPDTFHGFKMFIETKSEFGKFTTAAAAGKVMKAIKFHYVA